MKLSNNLSLAEMVNSSTAKRKNINNKPTPNHLQNMIALAVNVFEPIRNHFKSPIFISSGYRSKELNKAIKGSQTSQHSKGQAMDIDMDNTTITNAQIFNFIKNNLEFDQLIWEFGTTKNPNWVHVSFVNAGSGKNRNQILIAKKIDGKTIYQKF